MKYDPKQDRFKLLITLPTGDESTCWVTRKQWLGLAHRLQHTELLPELKYGQQSDKKNTEDAAEDAKSQSENSLEDSRKPSQDRASTPRLTDSIGVVKIEEGVRVRFVQADKVDNIVITLSPAELEQFYDLLVSQAGVAGWDLPAGLGRLSDKEAVQNTDNQKQASRDKSLH